MILSENARLRVEVRQCHSKRGPRVECGVGPQGNAGAPLSLPSKESQGIATRARERADAQGRERAASESSRSYARRLLAALLADARESDTVSFGHYSCKKTGIRS